ncbi:MAG: SCP2 sterol-binding domain-containing protein [Proteobacteria bacterium]|nr:SCP2 sterol-binding domain-containing protein [Pseudomonadota bacterium]
MPEQSRLSMRQMTEGMTLVFVPKAAEGLKATIQFDVTGEEAGRYFLKIAEGDCTFHPGLAEAPTLTITTSADIWSRIRSGEVSGAEALAQGLYQVSGDLELLMKFEALFSGDASEIEAGPDHRPAGPLPLTGMQWLNIAFVPWMVFWIFFHLASPLVSVWLPLALTAAIFTYRLKFDRPTFMEIGSLGFFVLAAMVSLSGAPAFERWGSIMGTIYMGGLWFASLRLARMPLCGEYSKWQFIEKLWRTSLFIHPNAVICLMWGWQFLAAALFGVAAELVPAYYTPFTVVRYTLMVPAFIFTARYPRGAPKRFIPDMEGALKRIRFWAGAGLVAAAGLFVTGAVIFSGPADGFGWLLIGLATILAVPAFLRRTGLLAA